ncbi:MAG: ABC transporter ATP-binding protein/permease [Treponema sp.]|nr:ABC transporter ATP-binding protein/permease [Treponema sp.]
MPPAKGFGKPKNTKKTIGRLIQLMKKYSGLWIIVFICVLLSSGAGVAGGYMIKPAINNYIMPLIGQDNPDLSGFLSFLVMVMVIYSVGAFAQWLNSRLIMKISTGVLYDLRVKLFKSLEELPVKYYDQHTHGELMSRFTNDTDTLREMMGQTVPQLVSSLITIVSLFVMMLVMNLPLTVLVIITLFLVMWLSAVIAKNSAKHFRAQQENIGKVNGFVEEMVEGQKVIKVFNHETKAKEEFAALSENLRKAGTEANTFGAILGPINNNLSHIQYAIIAIAGSALAILTKEMGGSLPKILATDLGTIVAFLQFTRSFSQPIGMMSQQANAVLNALAGAERIFAVIDEEPEVDEGKFALVNAYEAKDSDGKINLVQSYGFTGEWAWKNPSNNELSQLKGDVVFDNVTFGYTPEKTVLHNINIHAKPGMKIALVGSTGSGKTTTINLLTRFYDVPEENGQILFDGIPLNQISKDALRRSLGMVQQNTHLFTGTIRENIRYGNLNASDIQVYEAAKLANADAFIRHLPDGYDTVITGDGGSLSQGQRQLLAIARAAVANPPVLILDEATSSIDTRTEKLIENGMDSLMSGRTSFVIAHRLSTVRNADEIIVLEHGNIIERGTHEELLAKEGRYYHLYTGNRITLDE